MKKKKEIKVKLGTPKDKAEREIRKKNPYLKTDGSFDLIEKFPTYKDRTKDKKSKG